MTCNHETLTYEPSTHPQSAGYHRAPAEKLVAATLPTGRTNKDVPTASSSTFPAPLVLPDDELALDPKYPPQSLRSWLREKDRNPVTPDKNVVYVAAPPNVDANADFIRSWTQPKPLSLSSNITPPLHNDVIEYLKAFYHGLPVKPLPKKLSFTGWETVSKSKSKIKLPKYIGLNITTECVGIRTRAAPDGVFAAQLNLDDLLDAAISMLPEDAYALILLVDHDLFESDDDEFVCGRAYGGSRVAVISTSRPALKASQEGKTSYPSPNNIINLLSSNLKHRNARRTIRLRNLLALLSLSHSALWPLARPHLPHCKPRARTLFRHGPLRLLRLFHAGQLFPRRGFQAASIPLPNRLGKDVACYWVYGG
ncbi:hypothetical protein DXG01_003502 [Tephrocybe rancida]|nr:hypothetical protein DXG01_003502 [Tephrocybe rancida]